MRKTSVEMTSNKLAVDIVQLQNMLCVGKGTAAKVGEAAGAVIRLGRRKLYSVAKIEAYLASVNENA